MLMSAARGTHSMMRVICCGAKSAMREAGAAGERGARVAGRLPAPIRYAFDISLLMLPLDYHCRCYFAAYAMMLTPCHCRCCLRLLLRR